MLTQIGTFPTAHAGKYIQQLCKHFAHKVEVSHSDTEGRAALPPGEAVMVASEATLTITVSGVDADALKLARAIIDSHLERFAFRDGFKTMDWAEAV